MTQRIDITGQRFGRYVVQEYVANNQWRCRCDCGVSKLVPSVELRSGRRKSCGCLRKEVAAESRTSHGYSGTPTYETWLKMRSRCANPTTSQYKHYGGRGITVCKRWDSFENFLSDMGERPIGKTLDRIDVDGDYEPTNCRWATQSEQMNNTHRSVKYQGKPLTEWSDETGIPYAKLSYRFRRYGNLRGGKEQ